VEKAAVVFSNPDRAQKPLRQLALVDGKTLIMASPRLKAGFLQLSSESVRGREGYASTIRGAFQLGVPAAQEALRKVNLVITGCVAVDFRGFRLGKGGGYGDREISLLRGLSPQALVVTTVHELQLVDRVPVEAWDSRVDLIVTPKRIISCRRQSV